MHKQVQQNKIKVYRERFFYERKKKLYYYLQPKHPEQQPQPSNDGRLLDNAIGVSGGEAISSDRDDV